MLKQSGNKSIAVVAEATNDAYWLPTRSAKSSTISAQKELMPIELDEWQVITWQPKSKWKDNRTIK